jgi:DNA-binding MarR family transcriptional regulator
VGGVTGDGATWQPAEKRLPPTTAQPAGDRRRLNRAIRDALRDLGAELARLNQGVGGRLDLRTTDLDCLDLIARFGPLSPSALARRAGLHPATLTGVLDRLERGGWIARERDPDDRRAVVVRADRGRGAEVARLFLVDSGMNAALEQILDSYTDAELHVLADFVGRTAEAGRAAAAKLAAG